MSDRLDKAMDRLIAEAANAEAPPEIERALLAEFDRVTINRRRRKRAMSWSIAGGAIAASIAVGLILKYRPATESSAPSAIVEDVPDAEQPFVPIPYVAPLGAYERAEIVRMEVPVAALIAAGLPMRTADAGARAEADVVVGQDGRARAVRLISISTEGQ